jgi:hypothetical protein
MAEHADALGDEWLRRLREGERVQVYRGYRSRRAKVMALALALVFVIVETMMIARDAGLLQILLAPLVLAVLLFGHLYGWGRVAHSALQLKDDHFLLWDWQNRARHIPYRELAAVAVVKRFPRQSGVRVCHSEEGSTRPPEWRAVLTWPGSAPTASAVAAELARRAELTHRSPTRRSCPRCPTGWSRSARPAECSELRGSRKEY